VGETKQFLLRHGAAPVAPVGIEHVHDAGAQAHAADQRQHRTASRDFRFATGEKIASVLFHKTPNGVQMPGAIFEF
jgi:hypothetical protein